VGAGTKLPAHTDERLSEVRALLRHTIAGTFDFTGRSRRLEVGWYWMASMLVEAASGLLFEWLLNSNAAFFAGMLVNMILALPLFALFARRLHDHGRTGWWVLLTPPTLAANLYKTLQVHSHAFDPAWSGLGYWNLPLFAAALLLCVFIVAPGDIGENRYGSDPRLEPYGPLAD
jgi:uncharacterized membrane protein YhaH (DUF805 family)